MSSKNKTNKKNMSKNKKGSKTNKNMDIDNIHNFIDKICLSSLNTNFEKLIVAYEPIWAIGTGLIPEVSEISKIHDFIRVRLVELYGSNASNIPLLYGGSVNGSNASEIFNVNNVNGALIGGASLSFEKLAPIIRAIENTGP